ncbi:porphobilinogen synthase [Haematospirillum sp. H1815]|uniref:porphobilinogen synthase n=1 Tax=Haematospirillum sp. H1815 TaxID=2723108 RepID=UPI001FD86B1E|nr:porphobilinogen synthase [Haematospirillum sp. H1815]
MTVASLPGSFPRLRMRRNRQHEWSRRLMAEKIVTVNDLIWPVFIVEGKNRKEPVSSMPGVFRYSTDCLVDASHEAYSLGVPAIALFPCIEASMKNSAATEAHNPDNLVNRTIRTLKAACPELGIICDVALDPYTDTGHDGLVHNGHVINDETVAVLVQQALQQAKSGADAVAPSDMMDGRVGAVRDALDSAGFSNVQIIAYAAKYASAFYGPFRDAIGSAQSLKGGNKRSYQMDPSNSDEAMREVALDIQEGADAIIIKPGMPYLDILSKVRTSFKMPTWAYQVSGEYAMIQAAAQNGWLDRDRAMMESLLCFKRAGADAIMTYYALEAARQIAKAR